MDTFAIDEPMVTFGRNAARVWALSLGTTASTALFYFIQPACRASPLLFTTCP